MLVIVTATSSPGATPRGAPCPYPAGSLQASHGSLLSQQGRVREKRAGAGGKARRPSRRGGHGSVRVGIELLVKRHHWIVPERRDGETEQATEVRVVCEIPRWSHTRVQTRTCTVIAVCICRDNQENPTARVLPRMARKMTWDRIGHARTRRCR